MNNRDNQAESQVTVPPYVQRIKPFAGSHEKGIHYPLQNQNQLLLANLNGTVEYPLILANFFEPKDDHYRYMIFSHQTVFSSSQQITWGLNDKKDQEFSFMSTNKNQFKLDATKDKHQINAYTDGNFIFKPLKN